MKNKTAVKWLVEQFDLEMQDDFYMIKIQQAKKLEKEQIEKAYVMGIHDGENFMINKDDEVETNHYANEYYKETFKKQ